MKIRAKLVRKLLRAYIKFSSGKEVNYRGKRIYLNSVFNPKGTYSTDLLVEYLGKRKFGELVEVGSGSGALIISVAKKINYGIATDIVLKAAYCSKQNITFAGCNHKIDVVVADTLSCFRAFSLETVVFNPPYLPLDPADDIDLTICCGEKLELYRRFMKELAEKLKFNGKAFITCSSLTDLSKVLNIAKSYGFRYSVERVKRTVFDKIFLIKVLK